MHFTRKLNIAICASLVFGGRAEVWSHSENRAVDEDGTALLQTRASSKEIAIPSAPDGVSDMFDSSRSHASVIMRPTIQAGPALPQTEAASEEEAIPYAPDWVSDVFD
eukprot:CAMPEP_0183521548 /NCGR_PEP_ID=MMETSP0371-20130417/17751_1 /TAXON_ID=268820 /ORGANISM="Peridinium aciculiferum, Strain PAER-2" /LENGTH=107 /DNA_ID=CAMNT_0025720121 /DNA_START=58 /DNA_END=378 /DNA_ORIENTATION=-